ncbi:TetR/AcrR family transcriptional regulator [Sulfuriflexus mobilis]|uniref:TetR/AcrR family transcriptional regulator n=1 Tax=Sulfuriflexus mobilis TaxID=1811807 RepID=UPI000F81F0FE|nr:TetR/AcrR family transcriptional regulator [Sulfuriflexus mobilis]
MGRSKEFDPDEVLDKAMHLFWEKGYEATSMKELEQGLGINKFSIYNTFGNKHALFLATLKRYAAGAGQVLLDSLVAEDGIKSLHRFFDVLQGVLENQSVVNGCFLLNTSMELCSADLEARSVIQGFAHHHEDAFYAVLKNAQQRAELPGDMDLKEFSHFLLTVSRGMVATAKIEQGTRMVKSNVQCIKALLNSLKP